MTTTTRAPGRSAGRSSVSATSAARFAARVRRRRRQRIGMVAASLAGGLGLGWLVFASPLFLVRAVEVHGLHRLPVADVRTVAESEVGRSMALASPQAVADRVVSLRLVRHARVDRSWPSTLVVTVTEREPIAAVAAGGGRVTLLDTEGVVVDTVARAQVPAGVPLVDVDVATAGAQTLRAARDVVADVPAPWHAGVRTVRAGSPDDVTLVLSDGSTVFWGSAQDGDRKAAALLAVHPRPTKHKVTVDVSAPGAPGVTDH